MINYFPFTITLFYAYFISWDRKSETYALQWKYIDFENQTVRLKYALDKHTKRNLQKVEKILLSKFRKL